MGTRETPHQGLPRIGKAIGEIGEDIEVVEIGDAQNQEKRHGDVADDVGDGEPEDGKVEGFFGHREIIMAQKYHNSSYK